MMTLLLLLLITRLVTGQFQCPQVAASFRDHFDLSSLYVSLEDIVQADDTSDDTNSSGASGGGSCEFYEDVWCIYTVILNISVYLSS